MRNLIKLAAMPMLVLGVSGCDLLGSKKTNDKQVAATPTKVASAASRLCAANATYAKLKQSAFAEAKRIRERDTESLDALANASVVRMETPLLESRDDALGLTVCSGRMILELPPGSSAAFEGKRRLEADVTYSAQAAADGSGTVFKIDGGEPIVYRLANFDPTGGATRTAALEDPAFQSLEATAPMANEPVEEPLPLEAAPAAPPAPPLPARITPPRQVPSYVTAEERQRIRAEAIREARAEVAREARAAAAEQAVRAERTRTGSLRAERQIAAERTRRAERLAAVERTRRAERVAVARSTERGERQAEDRPTQIARPSFNCRYGRSRVEKMICGSNDLADRDRRMAALYYRTNNQASAPTRRALSASRLRFLAYRDRCGSAACVASAYDDRMEEIRDLGEE